MLDQQGRICPPMRICTVHLLLQSFLEPLKKCQVEGLLMDVEPDTLFGNLDELCHVSVLIR